MFLPFKYQSVFKAVILKAMRIMYISCTPTPLRFEKPQSRGASTESGGLTELSLNPGSATWPLQDLGQLPINLSQFPHRNGPQFPHRNGNHNIGIRSPL